MPLPRGLSPITPQGKVLQFQLIINSLANPLILHPGYQRNGCGYCGREDGSKSMEDQGDPNDISGRQDSMLTSRRYCSYLILCQFIVLPARAL